MKYENPTPCSEDEVRQKIESSNDESVVLGAVMSAVYYCETEFAGEMLLCCLKKFDGETKISLMRMVHTFMQTHRTSFLSTSFLAEMKKPFEESTHQSEILDLIDGVVEFSEMFGGGS